MTNKVTHYLVNLDEVVCFIYSTDKFGVVPVFVNNKVDLDKGLSLYSVEEGKTVEDIGLLELLLDSIPNAGVKK